MFNQDRNWLFCAGKTWPNRAGCRSCHIRSLSLLVIESRGAILGKGSRLTWQLQGTVKGLQLRIQWQNGESWAEEGKQSDKRWTVDGMCLEREYYLEEGGHRGKAQLTWEELCEDHWQTSKSAYSSLFIRDNSPERREKKPWHTSPYLKELHLSGTIQFTYPPGTTLHCFEN